MTATRMAVIGALFWPCLVAAQDVDDPDRFTLKLGALYVWDSDTEISIRSESGFLGTTINFERDLRGEETVTVPRIAGYFRFTPHHRLDYSWYRLEREGSRTISQDIRFADEIFTVGIDVKSEIDTELAKLAYTWSFYHSDKVELGLSVGAFVLGYDVALRSREAAIVADESFSSPLPMFGFRLDYTINRRWHVLFDVENFYIETDDARGSLDDLQLAVEYRPFRHVSFGLSANRLAIDVNVIDDDLRWNVSDLYRGTQFYVGLRY